MALNIEPPPHSINTLPLFRMAFRPFFLLAGLLAIAAIGIWMLYLEGVLSWQAAIAPGNWHGHEMVFGFGGAVIVGFLLTAVQTWTGRRSINGPLLVALVLCWLLARSLPLWLANGSLAALLSALWWLFAAVFMAKMVFASGNRRNYLFVPLLLLMAVADATSSWLGWHQQLLAARHLNLTGVLLISLFVTVIGGRVIPFFTARGAGVAQLPPRLWLEKGLLPLQLLAVILFGISYWWPQPYTGLLFIGLGLLHLLRMQRWQSQAAVTIALLWSLHLAYLFLAFGLVVTGLTLLMAPQYLVDSFHLLTIGMMAAIILAMMARVSLGHSGRPLKLAAAMPWAFAALFIAALVRGLLVLFMAPQWGWRLSALLWLAAFITFVACYWRIFLSPRIDGRDG